MEIITIKNYCLPGNYVLNCKCITLTKNRTTLTKIDVTRFILQEYLLFFSKMLILFWNLQQLTPVSLRITARQIEWFNCGLRVF